MRAIQSPVVSVNIDNELNPTYFSGTLSQGNTSMHLLGGILLILVIWWLAGKVAGPRAGLGAAALTTVALMLLGSGHHDHRHDRDWS
jgi:hypothetical protein